MIDYHDHEWGLPPRDDQEMFEKLCLEVFQAGLSWSTVLYKRDRFREAFMGFDPLKISRFKDDYVETLLGDSGIIRNRAKIVACVHNAKLVIKALEQGESITDVIFGFRPKKRHRLKTSADRVATLPESDELSKELRKRGWKFVGSTGLYATMQSMGVVNDHIVSCPSFEPTEAAQLEFLALRNYG